MFICAKSPVSTVSSVHSISFIVWFNVWDSVGNISSTKDKEGICWCFLRWWFYSVLTPALVLAA